MMSCGLADINYLHSRFIEYSVTESATTDFCRHSNRLIIAT